MKKIEIASQKEYDSLSPEEIAGSLLIIWKGRIALSGNARAKLYNNASATLSDNANAMLYDNAQATLYHNATATLSGNSCAILRNNACAISYENSKVIVVDNACATLFDNTTATLYDTANVALTDNACGTLYDNAFARLYGNAKATLYWYSIVCKQSPTATIKKKSKKATIIEPVENWTAAEWCEKYGLTVTDGKCIIYKRVSKDYETQENSRNRTLWKIGTIVEHPHWNPKKNECGGGKYHGCARPFFADSFRNKTDDRYIAIEVALSDMFPWKNPEFPHKVAFRKGKVLYDCDRFGTEIKTNDENAN